MCYNGHMPDDSLSHIPPHLIYLAEMIARDCAAPGIYNIKLSVPAHPTSAYAFEVGRYERMRQANFGRKRGRGAAPEIE